MLHRNVRIALAVMLLAALAGCGGKVSQKTKKLLQESTTAVEQLRDCWKDHAAHAKPVDDTEANRASLANIVADWTATIKSDSDILNQAFRAVRENNEIRSDAREVLAKRIEAAEARIIVWKGLAAQITRDGTEDEKKQFEQWKLDVTVKIEAYAAKLKELGESVAADYAKKEKKQE